MLRVDRAIRLALLRRGGVPTQFTRHAVKNGALALAVDGEFEVRRGISGESYFGLNPLTVSQVSFMATMTEQKSHPSHSVDLEGPYAQERRS